MKASISKVEYASFRKALDLSLQTNKQLGAL